MNPKIVIDTNVIVAASILEKVKEENIQVKHQFYDQSRQLFSIFQKRPDEKIGIAVPTVRSEAFLVLSKAVRSSFTDSVLLDIQSKEIFYDQLVALVNSCEHKMRYLFSLLIEINPTQEKISKNSQAVKNMAVYLHDLWKFKYEFQDQKERQSRIRAKPIKTEPKWLKDQKKEVLRAHREQISLEAKQLARFMNKYPNINDERILAETISIREHYAIIGEKYQFYIASCDTGFFSPVIYYGAKSDLVTKEINERFDIICGPPKVIFWIIDIPNIEN